MPLIERMKWWFLGLFILFVALTLPIAARIYQRIIDREYRRAYRK